MKAMRTKSSIILSILLLLTIGGSARHSQRTTGQDIISGSTEAGTDRLGTELDTLAVENKLPEGEVIPMTKALFIEQVCDYEQSSEWKYKGKVPAIIDLYADWCGPCRRVAPIMQELAKEYAGRLIIYKVNVDNERELAALFQANSIPTIVFIPMEGVPQIATGAAPKADYQHAIDNFLLKTKTN